MEGYALSKERGRSYFINEELRLENRACLGKKNDENRATSLIFFLNIFSLRADSYV